MSQNDPPTPDILEHFIEVTRTAKYVTLGEPSDGVRELWVVLHGYRQLARRFVRRFRDLAEPTRWIVAPEELKRLKRRKRAS